MDRVCLVSLLAMVLTLSSVRRACRHRKSDATLGPHFVKLLTFFAELLRSAELPDRLVNGVWKAAENLVQCSPALTRPAALELGFAELASSHLHELGTAAEWLVRDQDRMFTYTHGCIEHNYARLKPLAHPDIMSHAGSLQRQGGRGICEPLLGSCLCQAICYYRGMPRS